MATIYKLACIGSDDSEANIEITDKLNFPGFNDEWRCVEGELVFGSPAGGKVADWGRTPGESTTLSTGTATPHRLIDFKAGIAKGARGAGEKCTLDGSFPSGSFEWVCTGID